MATISVPDIATEIDTADTIETSAALSNLLATQLNPVALDALLQTALAAADTPEEAALIEARFASADRAEDDVAANLSDGDPTNDLEAVSSAQIAMASIVSGLRSAAQGGSAQDQAALAQLNAIETQLGLPQTVLAADGTLPPPAVDPLNPLAPVQPARPLTTNEAYPGVVFYADTGEPAVEETFPEADFPYVEFEDTFGTAPFDNIADPAIKDAALRDFTIESLTQRAEQLIQEILDLTLNRNTITIPPITRPFTSPFAP